MGLLANLLLFPLMGPIHGLEFIAGKISEQADEELYNPDRIRQELMALNTAFESGSLTDEAFDMEEALLMERLKEARSREAM